MPTIGKMEIKKLKNSDSRGVLTSIERSSDSIQADKNPYPSRSGSTVGGLDTFFKKRLDIMSSFRQQLGKAKTKAS